MTTKEIATYFKVTTARINQLRTGYKKTIKGKEYTYKPVLVENIDYFWVKGKLTYTKNAIKTIGEQLGLAES